MGAASPDGRVTIPAQLRRAAGIKSGQRLVAYVEDGRVVLEEWGHLLRRVQDRVAEATGKHPGSAVDELIAELLPGSVISALNYSEVVQSSPSWAVTQPKRTPPR
jgi:AbrB family looped-hinge helix DNA binding protein